MSYLEVERFLNQNPRAVQSNPIGLLRTLESFIAANEDPASSPNFQSQEADPLDRLMGLLRDERLLESAHERLPLCVLRALKILSRKKRNRLDMREADIASVLRMLHSPGRGGSRVVAEAANVILNSCYERENVEVVLRCNGAASLVSFLNSLDQDLQANAAGALQSICFQAKGRSVVRDLGAIPHMIALLSSDSIKVKTRAVGALHNMSSDVDAIRIIRRREGIRPLIDLLRSPQPAISGSAAGALQNVSREVASRLLIRDSPAVIGLADLLTSPELQTQVCAAGALLNILGPELAERKGKENRKGETDRRALARIISSTLVLSMVYDACFGEGGSSLPVTGGLPSIPRLSLPRQSRQA